MSSSDLPPVAASAPASRLVSRRPLIDRHGRVAGWDLRLSHWALDRIAREAAPRALRDTCWFALSQAAHAVVNAGQTAVVLPAAWTEAKALAQLPPSIIVRVARETEVLLPLLHAQAKTVAVPPALRVAASESGNYALLDGIDELRRHAGDSNASRIIAVNLESFDHMVAALRLGARYCCGSLDRSATPPPGRALPPQALIAAGILSALTRGRAPREVAELLKRDVALSFRLLRIVNSPAFGLRRTVDSLQDAVILVGARELHRWLCVLLLSADAGNVLAPALHEAALTRGRFFELAALARDKSQTEPADALFTTGAFSLLDVLLGVPLHATLVHVPLSEPARAALVSQRGPWAAYLRAALALERDSGAALSDAARELALAPDVLAELWHEATQWAAGFAAGLRTPD